MGVLDVGSNTVHMLVVDAHPGGRPLPAFSHKVELSLAAHLEPDNTLSAAGEKRLTEVVVDALRIAEDTGVEDFLAFATSAVRDAVNGDEVLARIQERTGATIRVLSGESEAKLTFLAARRWFGWSSGRLLVVDIGGGSLEIAIGQDEDPEAVMSLPLGAGRLTRDWFTADPPPPSEVRALRRHVRAQIAKLAGGLRRGGAVDHAVGTSKTFRQLARIAGAAPSSEGFYAKRFLKHDDLSLWAERLATMNRGRARPAARRLRGAGGADAGRRDRRGRGDGPDGRQPTRDLPVGAARGRDPQAPRRAGRPRHPHLTGERAMGAAARIAVTPIGWCRRLQQANALSRLVRVDQAGAPRLVSLDLAVTERIAKAGDRRPAGHRQRGPLRAVLPVRRTGSPGPPATAAAGGVGPGRPAGPRPSPGGIIPLPAGTGPSKGSRAGSCGACSP